MVNVNLKLPDDLLTDIKIGNRLTEKSKLQAEDIDEIDHVVKHSLYNTIRAE
jgi:hypothetical protein